MSIFRQIVAIGVSSTVALINVGQAVAETSPGQPQEGQPANQMPLQPDSQAVELSPETNQSSHSETVPAQTAKPLMAQSPQPQPSPMETETKPMSPAQNGPVVPPDYTPINKPPVSSPPNNNNEQRLDTSPDPQTTFPPFLPNGTLKTNPPAQLDPNSNPLTFPTKTDEVQVKETYPISLLQAIDLARRNNPNLQVAQLQLEQSQASLREARAALYPDLTFESSLERSKSAGSELGVRAQLRQLEDSGRSTDDGPENLASNTFNNSLQVSYDIDLFGRRYASIQASGEQVRARELEVERLVEQIRFDVTDIYLRLQNADGLVRINEAAVRNSQKSLQDAEALERSGVGTRFSVLQSQVQLANDQQRLAEARRDLRINKRRLAEQLNINQETDIEASDPIRRYGVWELSLEESIILAFKNRVELEQQLVQRDRFAELRKVELRSKLPRLNVFARYNVLGIDPDDASNYATRGWADGYTVGARLSWEIFDGGAARARAKQRELDIKIAEVTFSEIRNQVRREVEQAYFELNTSAENIQTAEIGVVQATEALRLARLRFQAGVGTQTDVINQETDLTRSQVNLLTAVIGYNRALSSLMRAVSNLPSNELTDAP